MNLRHLALAAALVLAAPASAVEPPPGTKNFTPPSSVPNYFSNESGPFGGGGAIARSVPPGNIVPMIAAPAPRGRVTVAARSAGRRHLAHNAKAKRQTRLARGRATGRQFAQAATRGGKTARGRNAVVARSAKSAKATSVRTAGVQPRGGAAAKTAAVKSRTAPGKGRPSGRSHG